MLTYIVDPLRRLPQIFIPSLRAVVVLAIEVRCLMCPSNTASPVWRQQYEGIVLASFAWQTWL